MKQGLILITLLMLFFNAQANYGDACYNDARRFAYPIENAANICRGGVGDACFADARKFAYSIENAANICRGFNGL